jgi:hypothetical protein
MLSLIFDIIKSLTIHFWNKYYNITDSSGAPCAKTAIALVKPIGCFPINHCN